MKWKSFQKSHMQVSILVMALFSWIIIGTLMYSIVLEKWSLITAFYFSVVTLSTVGYGDIAPTTELSRLFTSFYILFGVGIVFTAVSLLGKGYLEMREHKLSKRLEKHVEHLNIDKKK